MVIVRLLFKNFLQADVMRRLHSVGLCKGQLLHKYVLQARRHKNGKIQMRVECVKAYDTVAHPTLEQLELITFKSE